MLAPVSVRSDILELLRVRGIARRADILRALDEFLAIAAEENPDLPPAERDDDEEPSEDDDAGLAVRTIECPHCGEPVVVELELDGGEQEAIQDCSVCCRPIRLAWRAEDGRLGSLEVGPG
jgi:hypothetical protein